MVDRRSGGRVFCEAAEVVVVVSGAVEGVRGELVTAWFSQCSV